MKEVSSGSLSKVAITIPGQLRATKAEQIKRHTLCTPYHSVGHDSVVWSWFS